MIVETTECRPEMKFMWCTKYSEYKTGLVLKMYVHNGEDEPTKDEIIKLNSLFRECYGSNVNIISEDEAKKLREPTFAKEIMSFLVGQNHDN